MRAITRDGSPAVASGFTLLELLLTLGVLTAIAAITIPQLGGLLAGRSLDRAADQLRIEMTRARVDAMRQGRVMMIRIQSDTGKFTLQPFASLSDLTESAVVTPGRSALLGGADQAMMAPLNTTADTPRERELPRDVVFGSVAVTAAARSLIIQNQVAATDLTAACQPILFFPDGTTSTAAVELKHPESGCMMVKLRGITGEVVISPVATGAAGGT